MKQLLIALSLFGLVAAPIAPAFAATPVTKLSAQELALKKQLIKVKTKQVVTKVKLKTNKLQAKTDAAKVKQLRIKVLQQRAATKLKANAAATK